MGDTCVRTSVYLLAHPDAIAGGAAPGNGLHGLTRRGCDRTRRSDRRTGVDACAGAATRMIMFMRWGHVACARWSLSAAHSWWQARARRARQTPAARSASWARKTPASVSTIARASGPAVPPACTERATAVRSPAELAGWMPPPLAAPLASEAAAATPASVQTAQRAEPVAVAATVAAAVVAAVVAALVAALVAAAVRAEAVQEVALQASRVRLS